MQDESIVTTTRYSPSTKCFYPLTEDYAVLPNDLVEVPLEQYEKAMSRTSTETFTVSSDGEVTITQSAAPSPGIPRAVPMRSARYALAHAGKLDAVTSAIAAMTGDAGTYARIDWEFAQTVDRDSALVKSLIALLGLTEAQTDALFTYAATII